ncbi:thioredoxin family protein [Pseudomonas sp. PWP3-1b2]|uniref:thioredoxin family protein n=1 Tax=Pseudomonas sp. PWP3-1b2 TaxID=2804656 RepID=UPI003CEE559D
MGVANTVLNHPDEYWKIVKQDPWVFVLFVSEYCAACQGANKCFELVSKDYDGRVRVIILDVGQTPKIEALGDIGTPTLVVYKNGDEEKRYLGIGHPEDRVEYLGEIFSHHLLGTALPVLPVYW